MYGPEEIKEEHDIPNATVRALGQPENIHGAQVLAFVGIDTSHRFIITACETEMGITTTRHESTDVRDAGNGDFLEGILELMQRHAEDPQLLARLS